MDKEYAWECTVIKDEVVRVGMSDIKNRWLHSETNVPFEVVCFEEIINLNRFAQAKSTWEARQKEIDELKKQLSLKHDSEPQTKEKG